MNAYEILDTAQSFAVIGMSDDPEKYAYKIYHKLKEQNKVVYGINPKYESIEGDIIYPSLEAINQPIDVVVFLVNPKIGIHYLETMNDLDIEYVWLQPGSVDDVLLEKATELSLQPVEACVLALYSIHKK